MIAPQVVTDFVVTGCFFAAVLFLLMQQQTQLWVQQRLIDVISGIIGSRDIKDGWDKMIQPELEHAMVQNFGKGIKSAAKGEDISSLVMPPSAMEKMKNVFVNMLATPGFKKAFTDLHVEIIGDHHQKKGGDDNTAGRKVQTKDAFKVVELIRQRRSSFTEHDDLVDVASAHASPNKVIKLVKDKELHDYECLEYPNLPPTFLEGLNAWDVKLTEKLEWDCQRYKQQKEDTNADKPMVIPFIDPSEVLKEGKNPHRKYEDDIVLRAISGAPRVQYIVRFSTRMKEFLKTAVMHSTQQWCESNPVSRQGSNLSDMGYPGSESTKIIAVSTVVATPPAAASFIAAPFDLSQQGSGLSRQSTLPPLESTEYDARRRNLNVRKEISDVFINILAHKGMRKRMTKGMVYAVTEGLKDGFGAFGVEDDNDNNQEVDENGKKKELFMKNQLLEVLMNGEFVQATLQGSLNEIKRAVTQLFADPDLMHEWKKLLTKTLGDEAVHRALHQGLRGGFSSAMNPRNLFSMGRD